ncbi:hypothetical protein RSOLAG1IB_09652 [Rhizoctonia solani AG-1 IB]|uniref:Fungal-type protein kinase domain-containing protein n=1 Tax=Thanatephorus cucumeris (strain AG1-IB / isolate 7/3/14) TaxID=1108050 RepID=A0A0B7FR22_THACB|nr:hypothetical protein RSOLAG1IB_09652 [Rhizoctonia solani AG-1 IB]
MPDTYADSPTRAKRTHSTEYRSSDVASSRVTLTEDIPVVSEVTLDSLIDTVLAPIPEELMTNVCEELVSAGCIDTSDVNNPKWRCMTQNPSTSARQEGEAFEFLQTITEDIAHHSQSQIPPSNLHRRLRIAGNVTPLGARRNTSRPDGYFYLGDSALNTAQWNDIVMPMEFKKKRTSQNQIDDFVKVMWSMHHIMRNDPCRRFVHGLTCEDTKARLWFNNRCDVIVSEEFDLNKDWKSLVRIVLSILLANPIQLGYDPSIKIAPPTGTEPSYDITVYNPDTGETTIYRTTGMLSDIGVDSMVGRGTRVWKVQKLVNGVPTLPEYVLKDTWVYADREAEHIMLIEIREEQPSYAQHFLTPLDYGYVPLDPNLPSVPDNTDNMLGGRKSLRPTGKVIELRGRAPSAAALCLKTSSTTRDSVGCFDEVPSSPQGGFRDFGYLSKHPRRHYRIVFEECGAPVHDLRKFKDIFVAIQGGWRGLHAVHISKRVHRDVSSGNILLVPASGSLQERGVITDLEYAKVIRDTSMSHDVKTGTATFMATEVAAMEHKRLGLLQASNLAALTLEELDLIKQGKEGSPPLEPTLPPFRHNALHDMESIWWLCIWVIFYLVPTKESARKYYSNYRDLFKHPDPDRKHKFISGQQVYRILTTHLPEPFVLIMKNWSRILNSYYSICYRNHDASTTRLEPICVDINTVQASYKDGETFIEQLIKEASNFPSYLMAVPELVKVPGGKKVALKPLFTSKPSLVLDCVELPPPRKRQRVTTTSG